MLIKFTKVNLGKPLFKKIHAFFEKEENKEQYEYEYRPTAGITIFIVRNERVTQAVLDELTLRAAEHHSAIYEGLEYSAFMISD